MYIIVFVTAANKQQAKRIATKLISQKAAACVNIVNNLKSLFCWKGKIDSAQESLLIIKSKKAKFKTIVKLVKSLHSYEVPEIIAFPVIAGETKYLEWIDESLR